MKTAHIATLVMVSLAASGCSRLSSLGSDPKMSPITNPGERLESRSISMPMPAPKMITRNQNSLWQSGSTTFFRDQRASKEGDIITVLIDIKDEAKLKNETTRSRTASENIAAPEVLGLEDHLKGVVDLDKGIGLTSDSSTKGAGKIDRNESIKLSIAAVVTQKLPNGNMVINGRQEIRVNAELRELLIAGVIRPEDINGNNTVNYDQVAEARVSYGGQGVMSDAQRPRYGQQAVDVVLPW